MYIGVYTLVFKKEHKKSLANGLKSKDYKMYETKQMMINKSISLMVSIGSSSVNWL